LHRPVAVSARSRWSLGAASLLIGLAARVAAAQGAALVAGGPAWMAWLQTVVNLTKLIELGAFIFGSYQFWAGRRERNQADRAAAERARIDSNYQAWQVINSAQGKGGSGGRVEALADLLANGVSLAGIRLDDAWLEQVRLPGAQLRRASLVRTNLASAILTDACLEGADLREADLVNADLSRADLRGANVTGARLSLARLDGADLRDLVGWESVTAFGHASVDGVRHAPRGFVEHARRHGAVDPAATLDADALSFSRDFRAV
jgi:hypothetical protein